nr:PREDICTED: uncharacterized protein LOC100876414 [Megachile rotundata]
MYKSKANKKVLLFSSKHRNVGIAKNEKRVLETISFYNNTKYGVDILDQIARKYSTKAGSRRWPVHVFYNILDLAAINAWVIYKDVIQVQISRKEFLLQLAEELSGNYDNEAKSKIGIQPTSGNLVLSNTIGNQYNQSEQFPHLLAFLSFPP